MAPARARRRGCRRSRPGTCAEPRARARWRPGPLAEVGGARAGRRRAWGCSAPRQVKPPQKPPGPLPFVLRAPRFRAHQHAWQMPPGAGLPQDTHRRASAEPGAGAALSGAVAPTWAVMGMGATVARTRARGAGGGGVVGAVGVRPASAANSREPRQRSPAGSGSWGGLAVQRPTRVASPGSRGCERFAYP